MFESSWSIKISEPPLHAAIACLPEPSLVYQGKSNQLSVFSGNETYNLPIRKQIISLSTIQNEHVLVLTRYSLSCFDFLSNQQRFNKQFENAEKLFVINEKIYVTSGTSLYCYDINGQQEYVNHISAPITAITNVINSSGLSSESQDIVISTIDLTMLRYSKLNIVFDYGKIVGLATSLCWIGKGVMVGTQEGMIAFYESKKYKWKAKSVHNVSKILRFSEVSEYNKNAEFQAKKEDKIIVVRVDGNIELRDWQNGATLTKVKAGQNIINSFVSDFRKEGVNQILCVLQSGVIKAFNLKEQQSAIGQSKTATAAETMQQGDQIQKLNKIKQQLLFQINQLKNALQNTENLPTNQPILRDDFKMVASLDYKQGLILQIVATNGFISGLTFEQSLMPLFIDKTEKLSYKFQGQSYNVGELVCEVLVHSILLTTKYEVKKLKIHLPKFWRWGLDPTVRRQITGKLKFKLVERNSRFILWSKQCFFMNISAKDEEKLQNLDEMKLRFYNWYDDKEMEIIFNQLNGTVRINCECLKTMGEVFQDLINYIGIKHLNSDLQYPEQKQKIKKLLETVQKLSQTKTNITTDLADSINTIKFLLVKGESARVVGEMGSFRKTYKQIMEQNRNLITQIEKKNANTKILTETLKSVNGFINEIANVRYGQPKNQVIARCRDAIKKKKFPEIYSIMDRGADVGN